MILSAFPCPGGIQVSREIDASTIRVEIVTPDDPGWLDAVAAAAQSGTPAPEDETPDLPLATAQAQAYAAVNAVRGAVRLNFITSIPGQDVVYVEKERAAREWAAARAAARTGAAPEPDLGDFPMIAFEVGPNRTGATPDQVAQVYLNLAEQFRWISAAIEGCAMEAFGEIDAATTAEDALAAGRAYAGRVVATLQQMGIPV